MKYEVRRIYENKYSVYEAGQLVFSGHRLECAIWLYVKRFLKDSLHNDVDLECETATFSTMDSTIVLRRHE